MARPSLKVLISGAGIAGNALAFWLTKLGHDVTVVERHPILRASGLQLDLRGPGIEVLRQMGLEQAFRAKSAPERGMQVVDSKGRQRAYFPASEPGGKNKNSLTSEFEIMRGDLCRVFYDAATSPARNNGAKYKFGTAIESFEQDDSSVDVRFENGEMDRFDLLVGADGQWSRTRRMMLGLEAGSSGIPHADGLHPVEGLYFAYFTLRRPIQEGEKYIATSYIPAGRRCIMTRRHSPHEMQVIFSCKTDSKRLKNARRGDVEEEKSAFAEIFQGAGWQTEDLVKSMGDADDFYCERLGLVKLEPWSRGHVTLVGDAAYCPTVLTGMGTTSAVVGAYILAGEIGRSYRAFEGPDSLSTALKAYESKFRPFMEGLQKGVLENSSRQWDMLGSAFSVAVVNWALSIASYFRLNIGMFGVRDTVKGWELPRYEGILQD
ncbi:putative fad binding domain protein [Diaporthe ampelina]|uniref:Putative fad binding domain protein n=1 Tax=Diaporthe ampelina TaxID=1214573 RepID=A0A0G2FTY3_9PEZI|nr:putative fad binding domain protein [Diaporthe ampelina]